MYLDVLQSGDLELKFNKTCHSVELFSLLGSCPPCESPLETFLTCFGTFDPNPFLGFASHCKAKISLANCNYSSIVRTPTFAKVLLPRLTFLACL